MKLYVHVIKDVLTKFIFTNMGITTMPSPRFMPSTTSSTIVTHVRLDTIRIKITDVHTLVDFVSEIVGMILQKNK